MHQQTKRRKPDPIEAARTVARFLPADPAIWLECCARASVDTEPERAVFLDNWLKFTPGGKDNLIAYLTDLAADRLAMPMHGSCWTPKAA